MSERGSLAAKRVLWLLLVALLAAVAYAGRAQGGDPPEDALYLYSTAISGIVLYGILLGIAVALGRGLPKREFFALRAPASWPRAVGLAFAGYVAILIGAGVLLQVLGAGDEQGLTPEGWDSSRAGAYAANFLAVAFVGPIVEELLYRGAGVSLFAALGALPAVAITSLAFGLAHGLVLALAALVFFGIVTALLRLRTDSIYPCMLVHCAFNATSLVVAVAV
ncbi:MAG TPA: type II CAAX endopeptidase family protein [Gaiellaceae bacterium]|nr:type II CAAX endopeptidase family protein [Gaiellaceae bacterium]